MTNGGDMKLSSAILDDRTATVEQRLDRLAMLAEREADRVARLLAAERSPSSPSKRKGKAKAKGKMGTPEIARPTPEQAAHAGYDLQSVRTDKGDVVARAWRRLPWFESLAKREAGEAARDQRPMLIGMDEINALRFYRNAAEMAARSEMRCALNIVPGGVMPGAGRDLPPAVLVARENLALCETDMGSLLPTMRAVAVEDRTYAAIAMERFGSRNQDVYDERTGTFLSKPVPRSNRHPAIIKAEFLAGIQALVKAVRARVRTGGA
jgi:hypothetical protein